MIVNKNTIAETFNWGFLKLYKIVNIANKDLHGKDQNKFSRKKNCLQWV